MTNTNCLASMKCPECGNEACLRIEARIVCQVTDDGSEPTGHHQWDENSFCRCSDCDFAGTVRDFSTAEVAGSPPSESPDGLYTPWSLHFDREGTEDVAIICDADGARLVTSRHFWLPERNDPVPPTLAAVRVMKAGPKLLEAVQTVVSMERDRDEESRNFDEERLQYFESLIAEATGRAA